MADSGEIQPAGSISDLPEDELLRYGRELGLRLRESNPRHELLGKVRGRQTLIQKLDKEALLDIVTWMRWPVRKSAGKEELVRQIVRTTKADYETLSHRGLRALALLRDAAPRPSDTEAELARRIRKKEGLRDRWRRKRRSIVGGWMASLLEGNRGDEGEYHFLPDQSEHAPVRDRIENVGVVGGIARTIRGVADDYVHEKLDEIERRIDAKLEQIDQRLEEWRDREVTNRIRLLRITLITAIVVAVISLGYDYAKSRDSEVVAGGAKTVELVP